MPIRQSRYVYRLLLSTRYDEEMTARGEGDFDREFGARVAEARKQLQLSQRALSDALAKEGVVLDSAALSRIETGQRSPKLEEAVAIAEVLSLPLSGILPASPDVIRVAQARDKTLRVLDDALYKMAAAAGYLDNFGSLVEAHPDIARQLFRDENPTGRFDWEGWASWAIDSLAGHSYRRVLSPDDERAHAVRRVLRELADAVILSPIDMVDATDGVPIRTRQPNPDGDLDGEYPAAP